MEQQTTVLSQELNSNSSESKHALSTQMDSILRVAELLEKGVRNTGSIMRELSVSRPTAIKYRNEALKVIHQENKALNTTHMRNLEIGRLNYWIDWIQQRVEALTDSKEDREYRIKLLGRINDYQGRLHAITGLNTTVNVNYEEKKRITFVMTTEETKGDTGAGDTPSSSQQQAEPAITEGEIVDSSSS